MMPSSIKERRSTASSLRGSKFASIRSLPAADIDASVAASEASTSSYRNAALSGVAAVDSPGFQHSSVRTMLERESADEAAQETDERVRRHRYAQLVCRLQAQRGSYYSTSIFVQSMLEEVRLTGEAAPATRASVATWGLKLLAKESRSGTLSALLEAILPALYCHYTPAQTRTPAPAVQLEVRDGELMEDNPYFSHAMYVEEVEMQHTTTVSLHRALEVAVKANDERRHVILRVLERARTQQLRVTFTAWRVYLRQCRLVEMISRNKAKRAAEETALLRVQSAFYQWKLLVEHARGIYLTERLHDAAFQLENAKNQFQLQCYRADRLVCAAQEAADEAAKLTKENGELTKQVAELSAALEQREWHYNQLLTRTVSGLLRQLDAYHELVKIAILSKEEMLPTYQRSTIAAIRDGETANASSLRQRYSSSAVGQLRRWCDEAVVASATEHDDAALPPLRSLSTDFADGERYLCIMRHVFPEAVPTGLSVRNMETAARMRRIHEHGMECGLRYLLEHSDFQNGRQDLLVCSLSELHQRSLLRGWGAAAAVTATSLHAFHEEDMEDALDDHASFADLPAVAAEPAILLDEAAVAVHITEHGRQLRDAATALSSIVAAESAAATVSESIAELEGRLGCQRRIGCPIPLVEEDSRTVFWQMPADLLDDLREEPALARDARDWEATNSHALPAVLRDHVDCTSRLFYFFAGENAMSMSEVAFWRCVEACGVLDSPAEVPRRWVAAQYDRVVSPQLEAALKAAALSQSDMSPQELRDMAYQEMDIRVCSAGQFVELLVRVAVAAEKGEYGLVEGTRRLLEKLQLPNRERMTAVESDLYTAESVDVLRYFNEDYVRIFLFYIKHQESTRSPPERAMATKDGGRFAAQMSVTVLLELLDDCHYLSDGSQATSDGAAATNVNTNGNAAAAAQADRTRGSKFISSAQVRRLVPLLERQYRMPHSSGLTFTVFMDAMATLAYYWCPDPFTYAPRRLAAFLALSIDRLHARHGNSTLLLGTTPTVSLDGPRAVDFGDEDTMSGSG